MLDATPMKQQPQPLPFPYNKQNFCKYEPIEKRVSHAKVLVVNDLLRYESDLSETAKRELKEETKALLRFENRVSGMACDNIASNVKRLVKHPKTLTVHLSEVSDAADKFKPDAIVMSGTFSDFDYYNPVHIAKFREFITKTKIPVLAICGAHQLVGMSFGANLTTLDHLSPAEKRKDRILEYQYRFIKLTDTSDPIFKGITGSDDETTEARVWQEYTLQDDILRVWQNHGLQVEGVPHGFELLGTSYLCKNQMMVKRTDGQLIYSVQFHLEKSFEDWSKNPTRWEHHNESRDGRILFENFLEMAIKHNQN